MPWISIAQTGATAQTISFPPITGFQSVGGTATFSASASSGLAVTFSTTSAGVCTVIGNTASFSGAGTCTITAAQAGNRNYAPAAATQSFAVSATGFGFYYIKTLAGTGTQGYSGDGAAAISAQLYDPTGVAIDTNGNLYIADTFNNRIRKISSGGIISTIAGNGTQGNSGDGGPAVNASLYHPFGIAVDSLGNVYIADSLNYRIRKIMLDGTINTIAGNPTAGSIGDGGPATSAMIYPSAVAVDAAGNVYIADSGNDRIRKLTPGCTISTVAGSRTAGFGGDGGPATGAALFNPTSVAVDNGGNIYISDSGNNRIRKVTADSIITTIAGDGTAGFSGDGGPATNASLYPSTVATDSSGNVYIADGGNNRIRKVTLDGIISTIAGNGLVGVSGDGGDSINADVDSPYGLALDSGGNVFFADQILNGIRQLSPVRLQSVTVTPGSATVASGSTQQFTATAIYSDGTAYNATAVSDWARERLL